MQKPEVLTESMINALLAYRDLQNDDDLSQFMHA